MSSAVLVHRPRRSNVTRPRRSTHALARQSVKPEGRAGAWATDGSLALAPVADPPKMRAPQPAPPPYVVVTPSAAAASALVPAAVGPQAPGLRLTRRGRLAVTLSAAAVTILLAVTVVPAVSAGVAAAFSPPPTPVATVVVEPGQSLWQIAQATVPGGDTASVVARIADANGITSADELRPGQRLTVPLS